MGYVAYGVCGLWGMWPMRYVTYGVCDLCGMWPMGYVTYGVCDFQFGIQNVTLLPSRANCPHINYYTI